LVEESRMAKKKGISGEINKSDEVRRYMEQNPAAGPKAVVAALKEQGIEVSKSLVNALRAKAKAGKAPTKQAAGPPRRASAAAAPRSRTDSLSAADLLEAKKLVDQLGGVEQARRALETLEQLR
jgi:hypothetical protein